MLSFFFFFFFEKNCSIQGPAGDKSERPRVWEKGPTATVGLSRACGGHRCNDHQKLERIKNTSTRYQLPATCSGRSTERAEHGCTAYILYNIWFSNRRSNYTPVFHLAARRTFFVFKNILEIQSSKMASWISPSTNHYVPLPLSCNVQCEMWNSTLIVSGALAVFFAFGRSLSTPGVSKHPKYQV